MSEAMQKKPNRESYRRIVVLLVAALFKYRINHECNTLGSCSDAPPESFLIRKIL
jgi:hypothetical protein